MSQIPPAVPLATPLGDLIAGLDGFLPPPPNLPPGSARLRVLLTDDDTPSAFWGLGGGITIARNAETAYSFGDLFCAGIQAERLRIDDIADLVVSALEHLEPMTWPIASVVLHCEERSWVLLCAPPISYAQLRRGEGSASITDVSQRRRQARP